MQETLATVERWLSRIQTVQWAGVGVLSVGSSAAGGWWAQLAGQPWPLIALTALGGLCLTAFLLISLLALAEQWARRLIPLHRAARLAYEAAERGEVLDAMFSKDTPPGSILNHFKYIFLVDDETVLYGERPPSTVCRAIPREEYPELHPVEGESRLDYTMPLRPGYLNVKIEYRALKRIIRGHPQIAKEFKRE